MSHESGENFGTLHSEGHKPKTGEEFVGFTSAFTIFNFLASSSFLYVFWYAQTGLTRGLRNPAHLMSSDRWIGQDIRTFSSFFANTATWYEQINAGCHTPYNNSRCGCATRKAGSVRAPHSQIEILEWGGARAGGGGGGAVSTLK